MNEKTGVNRAKLYQLALFPMNNGATNVYFVLILSYVATFGNKVLGIAMLFASFMVTGMRVFDAITDPIIGAIMDKTDGKFGKFRPFMVLGNVTMAVSVILLYICTPLIPENLMWLRYVAFILLYAVWVIGYTFQTSVTRSAQPVLTSDPSQRPLFTVFNTIGSLVGMGVMQVLGMIMSWDSFAGDYGRDWFNTMTPIGIILSVILTILAIIGIWEKDQTKYFGMGGKQEKVQIKEYIQIVKNNKPLQRLMIAGGGCKLALSIATNVTVLCMLYGCMTQFGLGVTQGELLNNMQEVGKVGEKVIVEMDLNKDSQVLALNFNGNTFEEIKDNDGNVTRYKLHTGTSIESMTVLTFGEVVNIGENNVVTPKTEYDAILFYVDDDGKAAALELDAEGNPVGITRDENGKINGFGVGESNRIIGMLVDESGKFVNSKNKSYSVSLDEDGNLSGLHADDTVKLSGRNRYDTLNLAMMALGYVFSAPFFLLTVKTAQKHGQKKSLMRYVAFAFLCYIGVFVMMLLWKFGNPAWNICLYETQASGIKITINLYTVLFLIFFGLGYGAYYSTADMPIPMVADCSDYELYRSGKFIPGIMGTLFSLVDKLVSSLASTVVAVALLTIGVSDLATKGTPYVQNMNWVVIALFCLVPMVAWALTLVAMKGYPLDGKRVKVIQAVNAARKQAVADGMSMEEAMATINDETVEIAAESAQ